MGKDYPSFGKLAWHPETLTTTLFGVDEAIRILGKPTVHTSVIGNSIFVRNNEQYKRIRFSDILYLKADRNQSEIHTQDEVFHMSVNLARAAAIIDNPHFVRIHRSYIINLEKVDSFEEHNLQVSNQSLPIGTHYRATLMKKFVVV